MSNTKSAKYGLALLAAILILGQLALAHHALDHSDHADGKSCELCLLAAGLDQGLAHNNHSVEIPPSHGLIGNRQDLVNIQFFTTAFRARAPPDFLWI